MTAMGIPGEEQQAVVRILAGVLHLGNLAFQAAGGDAPDAAAAGDASDADEDVGAGAPAEGADRVMLANFDQVRGRVT